jgi:hypothetical protein
MKRNELFDVTVWQTRFCFQDIYGNMSKQQQEIIDNMNEEELEKFISDNAHSMENMMNAGIMNDWETVAQTVAGELEYPEKKYFIPADKAAVLKDLENQFEFEDINVLEALYYSVKDRQFDGCIEIDAVQYEVILDEVKRLAIID